MIGGELSEHRIELYTNPIFITGIIRVPFKRISDLLNRGLSEHITVHKAVISLVAQPPGENPLESPLLVGRSRVHLAVELPVEQLSPEEAAAGAALHERQVREAYVNKVRAASHAITGTFSVRGYCYLNPGAPLETLLHSGDPFIPITEAAISLTANPDVHWEREIVILNKSLLTAMYLTPPAHDWAG